MGNTEKVYTRVKDAEEIVKKLCEKHPDVLWCVRPDNIAVIGIENKKRSKKNRTLAKIKPVKGAEKFILQDNNIPVRYILELYYSDWNDWKERQKQWIIFHELLHIHHEVGKSIKHDCEDFKIILDKVGVNWTTSDTLPDLIDGDVKFNLELRPSMQDVEEEGGEGEGDGDGEDGDDKEAKDEKKDK